jgi:1-acyl-sn-glycerol-3-phosphate acyltransferase
MLELLRGITDLLMKWAGWKWEGEPPEHPKFVLVAAPHTSNWDFFLLMAVCLHWRLPLRWMGKQSLFNGPLSPLMTALGGIPVRPRQATVQRMIALLEERERIVLGLSPEGARARTERWRTGFWHIAHGARVPIATGFVDVPTRRLGIGPCLVPSGDFEADMRILSEFYAPMKGIR